MTIPHLVKWKLDDNHEHEPAHDDDSQCLVRLAGIEIIGIEYWRLDGSGPTRV